MTAEAPVNPKIYPFQLGDFRCHSISDGMQPIDAELLPTFFHGSTREELLPALRRHGISPDYLELQCNCLLIDTGDQRVLVDSGGGPTYDEHLGALLPGLAAAGYAAGDIDAVVLTHGHRDHVCGGVGAAKEMLFPNARHIMVRGEWLYWAKEAQIDALQSDFLDDIRFARECLLAIEPQLQLIEAGDAIAPGIRTLASPGHTRQHISLAVESAGERLICAGDTMDLPLHIERTDWHPAWDELPATGMEQRRALLRRAVAEDARIHAFHFPFPGLGRVRQAGAGWRFEPA